MTKPAEFDAKDIIVQNALNVKTNMIATNKSAGLTVQKQNSDTVTEMVARQMDNGSRVENSNNTRKQGRCYVPRCRMINRFDS